MFKSRYSVSRPAFEQSISIIQGYINPPGDGEFNFSRVKINDKAFKAQINPRLNFTTSETDDRTKKYQLKIPKFSLMNMFRQRALNM